jgi:hypothetical protein
MEFNHIRKRKPSNNKRAILLLIILVVVIGLVFFTDKVIAFLFN